MEPASDEGPGLRRDRPRPNRLRIRALLATAHSAEFGTIGDALGVADSVTSKQVKILTEAGYVTISKPTGKGRVKTWVTLTSAGQKAYAGHLQVLQEMAAAVSPVPRSP